VSLKIRCIKFHTDVYYGKEKSENYFSSFFRFKPIQSETTSERVRCEEDQIFFL
jgi:hypothetical protein